MKENIKIKYLSKLGSKHDFEDLPHDPENAFVLYGLTLKEAIEISLAISNENIYFRPAISHLAYTFDRETETLMFNNGNNNNVPAEITLKMALDDSFQLLIPDYNIFTIRQLCPRHYRFDYRICDSNGISKMFNPDEFNYLRLYKVEQA